MGKDPYRSRYEFFSVGKDPGNLQVHPYTPPCFPHGIPTPQAIVIASIKAQTMYTTGEDTLDLNNLGFELLIGIKAAREEEITAYYASLNMNTSTLKDIFPERSLQEQKCMFDREACEQRKQLSKRSRKSRSVVLPGEPCEEPMVYLYGESASAVG